MLTVSTLRSIIAAALGKETGAFIDALQARRMLPDDGTALTPRSVIVALLALVRARSLPRLLRRRGGCNSRLVASRASAGSA